MGPDVSFFLPSDEFHCCRALVTNISSFQEVQDGAYSLKRRVGNTVAQQVMGLAASYWLLLLVRATVRRGLHEDG